MWTPRIGDVVRATCVGVRAAFNGGSELWTIGDDPYVPGAVGDVGVVVDVPYDVSGDYWVDVRWFRTGDETNWLASHLEVLTDEDR